MMTTSATDSRVSEDLAASTTESSDTAVSDADAVASPESPVAEEALVEEVSIDGMCGVY